MNKMLLALAVATALTGSLAHADEAKPDNEVSFNVAGVSTTVTGHLADTLETGAAGRRRLFQHPNGTVRGRLGLHHQVDQDAGGAAGRGSGPVCGQSAAVGQRVAMTWACSLCVCGKRLEARRRLADADTQEVYGQLSYGPPISSIRTPSRTCRHRQTSKNSGYLDIGANIALTNGWPGNLHAATRSKNNDASSTGLESGVTATSALFRAAGRDRHERGKIGLCLAREWQIHGQDGAAADGQQRF